MTKPRRCRCNIVRPEVTKFQVSKDPKALDSGRRIPGGVSTSNPGAGALQKLHFVQGKMTGVAGFFYSAGTIVDVLGIY